MNHRCDRGSSPATVETRKDVHKARGKQIIMGKRGSGALKYAVPLAAIAALSGLSLAARAQQPPAVPKPGYVLPPENAGGLYPVNGEPIYKSKCAACHDNGVNRAPTRTELAGHTPEDIYEILTNGVMKPMAAGLSDVDLYGVVYYLTGKPPVLNRIVGPDSNPCKTDGALQPSGPQWNGWSNGVTNERYQPNPGFKTTDIPRLKVKWAFSYPGTKNTEPLIWSGRVFVGSFGGEVYSLDAKTGCVH